MRVTIADFDEPLHEDINFRKILFVRHEDLLQYLHNQPIPILMDFITDLAKVVKSYQIGLELMNLKPFKGVIDDKQDLLSPHFTILCHLANEIAEAGRRS